MRTKRLMRTWYPTDLNRDEDPEYVGAFSDPFPAEDETMRIVAVDWSTPGEVQVTWLISG